MVWHAFGIIGNGGFDYLFAGEFNGDPGFIYTAAAFKIIGATETYAAFQRALGALGRKFPADPEQRTAAYRRIPESERSAISQMVWDDEPNIVSGLARYIRARRTQFRQLLAGPPTPPERG